MRHKGTIIFLLLYSEVDMGLQRTVHYPQNIIDIMYLMQGEKNKA